jgi:hypothetical protein
VDAALVTTSDDGSTTCWSSVAGTRRRVRDVDRHGHDVATIDWTDDGRLDQAWLRLPNGEFVGVLARCGARERDELRVGSTPGDAGRARVVGDFAPLDYAAIDAIPVLAEPQRIPPHAGTAVLNLLATLAADAGRDALAYSGPYPTEALFLALLESFRYVSESRDPLTDFARGTLRWRPAPHTRVFCDETYLQRRGRVEKVVWQGRAYYRADWQGLVRQAPRRIHDEGDTTYCSLWALGRPLETHLAIAASDRIHVRPPAAPPPGDIAPLSSTVTAGVESVVIAQSTPALAAAVRNVARGLRLEWGPVERDLVATIPDGLRLSTRLQAAARDAMRAASDRRARLGVALALLTEIAALVGDVLRGRAQQQLEGLTPEAQARALQEPAEAASAPAIAAAADALAASAALT